MSKLQQIRKKPVLPLWLAALAWPVGALLLPVYTLWGLAATAVLSLVVYLAASRLCPVRIVTREVPYATGSEDVDAMLSGIEANLNALHALNDAIPDPQLSAQMDRMEQAGRGILQAVEASPRQGRNRSPALPGTTCPRWSRSWPPTPAWSKTASGATTRSRSSPRSAPTPPPWPPPLKTSWDGLYSAEAMDISTDIQVLDTILKSQNLAR